MKGFGQITRKYMGQQFNECNCLSLLYNIYKDAGYSLPSEYKGYNLDTYMAYWEKKPEEAIQDMIKLFETVGQKADPRFLKRGDVVVVAYKDSKFPSIYIGDNNIMVATREKGIIVLPLGERFQPVLARRLI